MKQRLLQISILALLLIPLAFTAKAFQTPLRSEPTKNADYNSEGPVTIDSVSQGKSGSLTVNSFVSTDNAWVVNDTTIKGIVRGDNFSNTANAPVNFGGPTNMVHVTTVGPIKASEVISSHSISAAVASNGITGTQKKRLCSNDVGKIIVCGPDPAKPVLTVQFDFNPPNDGSNYQFDIMITHIQTGQTFEIGTPPGGVNSKYVTQFTNNGNLPVGVYGIKFINDSCPRKPHYGSDADGTQFVLDRNRERHNIVQACS